MRTGERGARGRDEPASREHSVGSDAQHVFARPVACTTHLPPALRAMLCAARQTALSQRRTPPPPIYTRRAAGRRRWGTLAQAKDERTPATSEEDDTAASSASSDSKGGREPDMALLGDFSRGGRDALSPGAGLEGADAQADAAYADLMFTSMGGEQVRLNHGRDTTPAQHKRANDGLGFPKMHEGPHVRGFSGHRTKPKSLGRSALSILRRK